MLKPCSVELAMIDQVFKNISELLRQPYSEGDIYAELLEPAVWEHALQLMTSKQRILFNVLTIIVSIIAFFGNVFTLYVIFTRKQRLLFRVSLFSMALSDLIFVIVTSAMYISRLSYSTSLLWRLGAFNCFFLPFMQTMSVLVNSITLASIALDRYLAVVRMFKGQWDPGYCFCIISFVIIWGVSAFISSPMLFIYVEIKTIVIRAPLPLDAVQTWTSYHGFQCISDKGDNAYYIGTVFLFIFIPILLVFLWLNTVLAREIWKRRHPLGLNTTPKSSEEESSSLDMKVTNETNISSTNQNPSKVSNAEPRKGKDVHSSTRNHGVVFTIQPQHSSSEKTTKTSDREQRQIRMFTVIVVLMAVFFICRLPNWIFVLYKMNNSANKTFHWIFQYAFGVIGLTNCMLNPFMYTFLSETIRVTKFLRDFCVKCIKPCPCPKKSHYAQNKTLFGKSILITQKSDNGGVYLGD
ncbi:unnamed protein product [Diamesa serratosioi]